MPRFRRPAEPRRITKGETFEFPKPKKKFIPREPVKKKAAAEEAAEAEAGQQKRKAGRQAKPRIKPPKPAAE